MKRSVSLFLVLVMMFCTLAIAEDLSEYSKLIDLSVDYPVFSQKDIQFPLVDEPIEINVMFPRNPNHPNDFTDMWWRKHVAELTGITFNFELIEQGAWEERKNLSFISGDYPEAFFTGITDADELVYGYSGKLLDLKPLIKEYAPNLCELYKAFPGIVKGTMMENGAIYIIPMTSYTPRSSNPACTLVNSEWLEAVGMDVPTNTDEFYDVLKAFKEMDPNGNGEEDEIPVSMRAGGNDYLLYAFGFTDFHNDVIDDQYVFVPATDNYRAYVEYMHRLYSEGLLDSTYFTQDDTELGAKLSAEKVGFTNNNMTILIDDYQKYIAIPAMTSPVNDEPVWPMTAANYKQGNASLAITDKCSEEKAIALIKFCDYLVTYEASMAARLGPSQEESVDGYGYTYDYIENKHAYGATREFPDEYADYSSYRYTHTPMNLPAYINPLVDDVVVGSDDKNTWLTVLWNDAGIYAYSKPVFSLQATYTEEEQNAITFYQELISYSDQARAKFISGDVELNDDTWNAYLDKLAEYGLEEYCAINQSAYERYLAQPDTLN